MQRRTTGGGWWQGSGKVTPAHQQAVKETGGDGSELDRLLQIMDQAWIKRTA
jgi:hypothetical protein